MFAITTDPARARTTVRATGSAVPAWRITATTTRAFRGASSPKRRRRPTIGASKTSRGIRGFYNFWEKRTNRTAYKKVTQLAPLAARPGAQSTGLMQFAANVCVFKQFARKPTAPAVASTLKSRHNSESNKPAWTKVHAGLLVEHLVRKLKFKF